MFTFDNNKKQNTLMYINCTFFKMKPSKEAN